MQYVLLIAVSLIISIIGSLTELSFEERSFSEVFTICLLSGMILLYFILLPELKSSKIYFFYMISFSIGVWGGSLSKDEFSYNFMTITLISILITFILYMVFLPILKSLKIYSKIKCSFVNIVISLMTCFVLNIGNIWFIVMSILVSLYMANRIYESEYKLANEEVAFSKVINEVTYMHVYINKKGQEFLVLLDKHPILRGIVVIIAVLLEISTYV